MKPPGYTPLRDQMDSEPPRLPPANGDAETALLGAILLSNAEYRKVAGLVTAGDFAWAAHQRIFAALGKLIGGGQRADPITLGHLFGSDAAFPDADPPKYLAKLAVSAVTLRNSADYAAIIADCAITRSLITALEDRQPGETHLDVLEQHRARICSFKAALRSLRGGDDATAR